MSSVLNPYLMFRGDARRALEFYRSVFGGQLTVTTFVEAGVDPHGMHDGVMHGQLSTDAGFTLMAADVPPQADLGRGSQVVVSVSGDAAEELRRYWDLLSGGAEIRTPLERQSWGDEFGQLVDRFGIEWLVDISGPTS